jgi:ribonuclease HI
MSEASWVKIGKQELAKLGIETAHIAPEFISRTWTEPCVQEKIDEGRIKVSLQTVKEVEWEMTKHDVAIFADGSSRKGFAGCGAAVLDGPSRVFVRAGGGPLGRRSGSLTAEKEAVRLAIRLAKESGKKRVAIFTDSLEALRSIASADVKSVVDREIKRSLADISFHVEFLHVRGHSGVPGNELANFIAQRFGDRAYQSEHFDPGTTVEEAKSMIKQALDAEWDEKLKELADTSSQVAHAVVYTGLGKNPVLKEARLLSRREEMLYNRLRTKAWAVLPDGRPGGAGNNDRRKCPWCCGTAEASHILESCPGLQVERAVLLGFDSNEPILRELSKVAPYIKALIGKMCQ